VINVAKCEKCDGTKLINVQGGLNGDPIGDICPVCHGTGETEPTVKELIERIQSLELELDGIMFMAVEKWLDEDECKGMDNTQKACYVREKVLKIIEKLQAQVKKPTAREVWEKMRVKCNGYKYFRLKGGEYSCDYMWLETKNPEPCTYETCPLFRDKKEEGK